MNYNEFLHTKVQVAPVSGFTVRPEDQTCRPEGGKADPDRCAGCRWKEEIADAKRILQAGGREMPLLPAG